MVNGKLSTRAGISSGMPQGSVIGPILFVIFINDLTDYITCIANIFANDTKLFHGISSHENCLQLQDDLNRLVNWYQKWQMGCNEAKCNVLHLSSTNPCYHIISLYSNLNHGILYCSACQNRSRLDLNIFMVLLTTASSGSEFQSSTTILAEKSAQVWNAAMSVSDYGFLSVNQSDQSRL